MATSLTNSIPAFRLADMWKALRPISIDSHESLIQVEQEYLSPRRCEPADVAELCQEPRSVHLAVEVSSTIRETKGSHRETAVYILNQPGSEHCKIGIAHDPAKRLEAFQVAHWKPIGFTALFWIMDGSARGVEMLCHRVAGKIMKKARGEWVNMDPEEAANLVATVAMSSPVKVADSAMWLRNRERLRLARAQWVDDQISELKCKPTRTIQTMVK